MKKYEEIGRISGSNKKGHPRVPLWETVVEASLHQNISARINQKMESLAEGTCE